MFKIKRKSNGNIVRRRQARPESDSYGPVFSYHANRSSRPDVRERGNGVDNEPSATDARQHKPHFLLRRGSLMAMLIIIVAIAILNLSLKSTPKIVVSKSDNGTVFLRNQDVYNSAAHDALTKSFFNNNKLTINSKHIAEDLQSKFPELVGVKVKVPIIGGQIIVQIQPATPSLLLSSGSNLYVVDNVGRALLDAKQVPNIDKLGLPVVTDQSNIGVVLGKPTLPSANVDFITEVAGQLKANKVAITSLTLPAGANELDVRVDGVPYFVKFNLRGNGRVEAGAYLAVKKQLEREKITPSTYVDVRVEDRAYYK
ncbi:MAG TPA: hypothetical protein VMR45_06065 [Patescibacteria group bacterium]|nr:hypothetical protein [Patescibacteria group bacterium]